MNRKAVALVVMGFLLGCAPEPKFQACHDDTDCKTAVGESSYCIRSRCVECVSSASCPRNEECIEGACKSRAP